MEYVSWGLLVGSLVVAAWYVWQNDRPFSAEFSVDLSSLEVTRVAAPRRQSRRLSGPGGFGADGPRGGGCDEGALRAESTVEMERLAFECNLDGADGTAREGFLEKLSSKRRWQPRYVVLTESHLCYLSAGSRKKDRRLARFAVALRAVTSASRDEDELCVAYGDRGILTLRARDAAAAEDWVGALRRALPTPEEMVLAPAPDGLSKVERACVETLRFNVADDGRLGGWVTEDASLVRFLRARDMDLGRAEAMLRAHGAWRKASRIDARVGAPRTAADEFIERWWPDGLLEGADHAGLPVQLVRLGAADLPGIEREVGKAAFIDYCARKNEECFARLRQLSADRGATETSCSLIIDMKGLGARHARGVPLFTAMLKVCEPNYPERLKRIIIVRAPWIFATLDRLIKPMLNEGTASKVMILAGDFAPVLLKYVPEDALPPDLGGSAPDPAHIAAGGAVPRGQFELDNRASEASAEALAASAEALAAQPAR